MFKFPCIASDRTLAAIGLAAISVATRLAPVHAEAPSTQPADQVAMDHEAIRSHAQKLFVATGQFKAVQGDQSALRDPARRAQLLAKLVPLHLEIRRLQEEVWAGNEKLNRLHPTTQPLASPAEVVLLRIGGRTGFLSALIAAGDENSLTTAKDEAASTNPRIAKIGKLTLLAAAWLQGPDEAAQLGTLDGLSTLLKTADPKDLAFQIAVEGIIENHGATALATQRWRSTILEGFPNKYLASALKMADRQAEAATIFAAITGKPMVLAGATVDGTPLSTDRWKGKVILIDFWASWCGPCKAELPHVKALYQKYHEQGLEVLGVSNDFTPGALSKYLAGDPAMVWPSLFDPAAAAAHKWHPLSVRYGIVAIPRMFLIDRNGVCRTVEARQNMDQMIPKLLAEATPSAAAN